ncbi:CheR family methyltransferase [Parathalassolituus penaei]|uniref:Chemotaxis protein methyltransferase n=1 Tax=Parathalassolituus penaei TaxID=2997323 RepID=A0A9X3EEC9_9GAMM|nr:protein-glutamate O-methyltransferase [Parathalassolituus penaei]MCY0966048.1 protein-glutamate O-methyltransferase [Parathalassolituus penaei]
MAVAPVRSVSPAAMATEFQMTDADFAAIAAKASRYTGIVLGEHKRSMVYSRIARRLRATGLGNFRDYLAYLEANPDSEMENFINAITTNLTSFFREPHHFKFLEEELLPKLKRTNANSRRIRIWSAGSSIGQEAYSIAICVLRAKFPKDWDVRILATDLDSSVLETGRNAVYPIDHLDPVEDELRHKYFRISPDGRKITLIPEVKSLVSFKRLNLLEPWPMKGPFDLIFCRNVVIYFNKDTQRVLFDRYADMLPPEGHLFIGHSENLAGVCDRFQNLGQTIYRKIR